MPWPFVPQLVVQAGMQKLLTTDAGVQAAMEQVDASVIVPNLAPARVEGRHVTHGLGGMAPEGLAVTMGGVGISMVSLYWDITAWNPSLSQISMEPVMLAVFGLLLGENMNGETHLFIRATHAYTFFIRYAEAVPVQMDVATADVWAPVRERFIVSVSPREG